MAPMLVAGLLRAAAAAPMMLSCGGGGGGGLAAWRSSRLAASAASSSCGGGSLDHHHQQQNHLGHAYKQQQQHSYSSTTTHQPPQQPPQQQQQTALQVTVEPLSGRREGVSLVLLRRAEARNALGRTLVRELFEALDTLRQERMTRCVVVASAVPGCFCSGADLKERAAMTAAEAAETVSTLRRLMGAVAALPMPTVAAVDGYALGGGAELALACDLRVAGAGAAFAFPETRLGIIPGAGGTQRLPRLVGAAAAKELAFTARRVGADEAAALGLVSHVAGEEQGALERALDLAADIAQSAPLALRMAKAAIDGGAEVDLHSGLALEQACYAQLLHTKDRLEGLRAFAEKRAPRYTGE